MAQKILIQNATVVNYDSIAKNQSIFIEGGVIKFVGDAKSFQISIEADVKVIDGHGM